jgi:hypothetical protein
MRLLISAVEQLLAISDSGAFALAEFYWEEIGQAQHMQRRLADSLDRLELLRDAARGLRELYRDGSLSPLLLQLIPLSWARPFPEIRPLLLQYLAEASARPRVALRHLDTVVQRASAVMVQLGQLLDQLQDSLPPLPEFNAEALGELVRAYLDPGEWSNYASFRHPLLDWCVQEAVPPELVARLIGGGSLFEQVSKDGALRWVCWGCRLFGA